MLITNTAPPRRTLAVLCSGVLLVLFSLTGSASAEPTQTPDSVLLAAYQPVLVFHPSEAFRPTKVQSFVEDSELERFVGTSPHQLPLDAFWTVVDADPEPGSLPGPAPGAMYRLDQAGCEADGALGGSACYAGAWAAGGGGDAVYGRVVRSGDRTLLQYWLFYYDNPLLLPTPLGTFWQSHEGDWEVVNVVLDENERPLEGAYSQHCSGRRLAWDSVVKSPPGSTHPVAYVALGSHANYFAPGPAPFGAIPIDPACIPPAVLAVVPPALLGLVADRAVDGTSAGATVGPPGSGADSASIHPIEGTPWSSFAGRWGESEYFFTPVPLGPIPAGAVPVGLAPATPTHQATWNAETILGWPLVS